MPNVDEITRSILLGDGDELRLETEALFSIWRRPDGEGFDAFLEPVPVNRCRRPLTRDDLCRFWGERTVEAAERDALAAWLVHGPAALRQTAAEERERIRGEAP